MTTQNPTKLALDLVRAVNAGDEEEMLQAENEICEHLNISEDETFAGLTENAVRQIEEFVAAHTSRGWSYAS